MTSLEFAIRMEHDGEQYYKQQAELNKDNAMHVVFMLLAKDEANHARVLKEKFEQKDAQLKDNTVLKEANNVFVEIKNFLNTNSSDSTEQIAVYEEALKREKESIDLYEKLTKESKDETDKTLFKHLVNQEKDHYNIFDNLITMVRRPEDWIESAEFGLREQY